MDNFLAWLQAKWDGFLGWFKDSETILWARIQLLLGVIMGVLVSVDLSPILNEKQMMWWLIGSGIMTELMRRWRAEDM